MSLKEVIFFLFAFSFLSISHSLRFSDTRLRVLCVWVWEVGCFWGHKRSLTYYKLLLLFLFFFFLVLFMVKDIGQYSAWTTISFACQENPLCSCASISFQGLLQKVEIVVESMEVILAVLGIDYQVVTFASPNVYCAFRCSCWARQTDPRVFVIEIMILLNDDEIIYLIHALCLINRVARQGDEIETQ